MSLTDLVENEFATLNTVIVRLNSALLTTYRKGLMAGYTQARLESKIRIADLERELAEYRKPAAIRNDHHE